MDNKYQSEPKITNGVSFVPEKLAQRCPVCNGFGTLKYGAIECQACKGLGYVLVPARKEESK